MADAAGDAGPSAAELMDAIAQMLSVEALMLPFTAPETNVEEPDEDCTHWRAEFIFEISATKHLMSHALPDALRAAADRLQRYKHGADKRGDAVQLSGFGLVSWTVVPDDEIPF